MNGPASALQDRLLRQLSRLSRAHALVEPGDRIMVACSGGNVVVCEPRTVICTVVMDPA